MPRRFSQMLAVLALTGLLASATLEAQRGGMRGGGFRPAGFAGHGNFSRGFGRYGSRSHYWGGGFLYPDFLSDDDSYAEPVLEPSEPPVVVRYQREPEKVPAPAQLIEIPGAARPSASTDPKPLPPAMFILTNGERLEARRFVLTASSLSITVNRAQRMIPLNSVDLDATEAANRERGIHLEIPADPNEISLSF
jgi:hypothetical protein